MRGYPYTIGGRLVRTIFLAALLLSAGCAQLPSRGDPPPVTALPVGTDTALDKLISPATAKHPGESGFFLLPDGTDAFAIRARISRSAGRSLDVQYYIWHNDLTGKLLARELLMAADRGVRVRLLLDDMDARAKNFALGALAAHPNIEVRLFNPFASRDGNVSKGFELLGSFNRINHRMHNKTWIADNRIAIAGGRNIGDEYFSAGEEVNFRDMDIATIGGAVEELSTSFDRYWNSPAVWSINVLSPDVVNDAGLQKLRADVDAYAIQARDSEYIKALATDESVAHIIDSSITMQWTPRWQVMADDPTKALEPDSPLERSAVLRGLGAALHDAKSEMEIISPYFIPGKDGTAFFVNAAKGGRAVRILTNSLVANDVAAVHGGYAKYRPALIESGVELWELKPDHDSSGTSSMFGSSGASLHSKTALIDRNTAFVGSFNLDPRSVSLNCEQGILVTNDVIAGQMQAFFDEMTAPSRAWRVTETTEGKLSWSDGSSTFDNEPNAGFMKRMTARFAGWLPVEPLL